MQEELTLYSIDQVLHILPIGRSTLYEEMRAGRLAFMKIGTRRLIAGSALRDYINHLAAESDQFLSRR